MISLSWDTRYLTHESVRLVRAIKSGVVPAWSEWMLYDSYGKPQEPRTYICFGQAPGNWVEGEGGWDIVGNFFFTYATPIEKKDRARLELELSAVGQKLFDGSVHGYAHSGMFMRFVLGHWDKVPAIEEILYREEL